MDVDILDYSGYDITVITKWVIEKIIYGNVAKRIFGYSSISWCIAFVDRVLLFFLFVCLSHQKMGRLGYLMTLFFPFSLSKLSSLLSLFTPMNS